MRTYHIFFISLLFAAACNGPQTPEQHPTESSQATIADVETGIRAHITREEARGEGLYRIQDDSLDLAVQLVRVHTEYLSVLGEGAYFACVDLVDSQGDVYDVDFFMAGEKDSMYVTQTTVHKLNGKPFYTWKQAQDETWFRVPVEKADQSLLGVIEGQDQFEFYYQATLPSFTDSAQLWLPIPSSNRLQKVRLLSKEHPGMGSIMQESEYGNRYLYLKLGPADAGKVLKLSYAVERQETGSYRAEAPPAPYSLQSSPLLPTGGRFKGLVDEILLGKMQESDLVKARAIYDYVVDNVRYAKAGTYGTGDANYACDTKSGNCTEFHSLFISLARTAGIPARFYIGAGIPSERNEGGVFGYHCWAEFYAEGKWWPVDISEANKYSALATYYFGHHPANRVELSRGRDLQLHPTPVKGPLAFFAYPHLEVDGVPLEVKTRFSFKRLVPAGDAS